MVIIVLFDYFVLISISSMNQSITERSASVYRGCLARDMHVIENGPTQPQHQSGSGVPGEELRKGSLNIV